MTLFPERDVFGRAGCTNEVSGALRATISKSRPTFAQARADMELTTTIPLIKKA